MRQSIPEFTQIRIELSAPKLSRFTKLSTLIFISISYHFMSISHISKYFEVWINTNFHINEIPQNF